jgi:hypothetical protein
VIIGDNGRETGRGTPKGGHFPPPGCSGFDVDILRFLIFVLVFSVNKKDLPVTGRLDLTWIQAAWDVRLKHVNAG